MDSLCLSSSLVRHYFVKRDTNLVMILIDVESPQIYNSTEQKIALLRGQLRNVSRAIANIQKMEIELRTELKAISGAEFAEFMLQEKKKDAVKGLRSSAEPVKRKGARAERKVWLTPAASHW